jgi:ribosomal protein S18 acetylase RimI-like enzyme
VTRPVHIDLLPAAASADAGLVAELTEVVNRVYASAEEGLWADGAVRTTGAEMRGLIGAGQIAVARVAGRIAGCVRVQRLETGEGEFGLLCTDPAYRGTGVGRELVRFAEREVRDRGLRTVQLELLVPRSGTHPFKQFLQDWYTRSGYRLVRVDAVETSHPHLGPLLATACDFRIYHKDLGQAR